MNTIDILGDKDKEGEDVEDRVGRGEIELPLLLLEVAVPEILPPTVPVIDSELVLVEVSVLVPVETSEGVSAQEKGERNEVLDIVADEVRVNPFTPPVSVLVKDPTDDWERMEEYEGEDVSEGDLDTREDAEDENEAKGEDDTAAVPVSKVDTVLDGVFVLLPPALNHPWEDADGERVGVDESRGETENEGEREGEEEILLVRDRDDWGDIVRDLYALEVDDGK